MIDKTYWNLLSYYNFFSNNSRSKEYQVIFTFGEDSQVSSNNFNWTDELSSVKLIKLPQKNLKSLTESGEKFNLKKFTQVRWSGYRVIWRTRELNQYFIPGLSVRLDQNEGVRGIAEGTVRDVVEWLRYADDWLHSAR